MIIDPEDGICPECGADLIRIDEGAHVTSKYVYDKQEKDWVVDGEDWSKPEEIRYECTKCTLVLVEKN